ncbi:hypothetical protein BDU57DRAFT_513758 [Ampelomyces quisqualis]|uniref:Uncharacterized protein n=1 Tax=Ampelomyces quisqualis TaxID=50730 RepID=A0A6A5QP78_AMPQU|nr:hypothetical protein BDU57DRAFT_513758 [Ampelomyces quisqualis]
MAVVIETPENRLAMAKPPPKKLDAQEAGKISEERRNNRPGECLSQRTCFDICHRSLLEGSSSLFSIAALAKRWKILTRQSHQ